MVPRKTCMPCRYAMKRREQGEQDRRASRPRQIRRPLSCGDNQFAMKHWKMLDQVAVLIGHGRRIFVLANVQSVRVKPLAETSERKRSSGKHFRAARKLPILPKQLEFLI